MKLNISLAKNLKVNMASQHKKKKQIKTFKRNKPSPRNRMTRKEIQV